MKEKDGGIQDIHVQGANIHDFQTFGNQSPATAPVSSKLQPTSQQSELLLNKGAVDNNGHGQIEN